MKKHFLLIGSLLCSSMVFGAGYELNLQGMRQMAMGGTGAAVPWDVSTIYYNPGGLTSIRSLQAYGSINARMPRTRYVSAPTGTNMRDAVEQTFTPFSAYIGAPVAYKSRLSVGLGVYSAFGTGIKWPDDWTGRFMVREMSMNTTFFQPTVSYKITDEISFGAGFIYATGNFTYRRAIALYDQNGKESSADLTGKSSGVGYNLGLHIKAGENFQFGITYRSQVNMKIKNGYAQFNVPASMANSYLSTAFSSTIPMPQVASFGVGWKVNDQLHITAEANYTGWSAYDSLRFNYKNNYGAVKDEQMPRRYRNTVSLRAGVKYDHTDRFSIMAGFAYLPTPVRNGYLGADMPDAKSYVASAGLSYKLFKRLTAVGVFQYTFMEKRIGYSTQYGFTGRYQTRLINPGLALIYDLN